MKRLILAAFLLPSLAFGQTIPTIPATGPNGTISRTDLQNTMGQYANALDGTLTNSVLVAPRIGPAQADSVGQMLSVTASIPSPTSFATILDPIRSIVGPFTSSLEFGGRIGLGNANAIVGGIVCPANIAVGAGTYCGGISGYAYNLASRSGGVAATATGVGGYGGIGATSGFAYGLVGFVTNCMGPNCPSNTGFGGAAGAVAGLTGQENDVNTYLKPDGTNPDYGFVTGLLIQGTADSSARWSRAHSNIYGLLIQVLDANNYATTPCNGDGTQSHCWDAAYATSDGSSFVGLQLGALQTNLNGTVTAASQNLTFSAYNAGAGVLGTMYVNPSGEFVMQTGANGSIALTAAGTPLLEVSNTQPAVATTSLTLLVNSPTGGIRLVPVTMGGANTGGAGFRFLTIPN